MKDNKTFINVIIAAIIFFLLKLLIPPVNGLTPIGVTVIAAFVITVYLWITEGTSWPSLLGIMLFCLSGVKTVNEIFAAAFGSWLIPFLIITMLFSVALSETGVIRRIITWFITRNFVEKKPWAFTTMFLVGIYFVALFMDCTAAAVFVLPLCTELYTMLGFAKGEKYPKMLLIGSIATLLFGFMSTPIGHVIPLMYMGYVQTDFGVTVSMIQYTAMGFPAAFAAFIIMLFYFRLILKPDVSKLMDYNVEMAKKSLPPMSKQEKLVSAGYVISIFFWLLPDIGMSIIPEVAKYVKGLGYVVAPSIAIAILNVIKVDDKPVVDFAKLLPKVSMSLIFLVACMNTLNLVIPAKSAGITLFLGNVVAPTVTNISSGFMIAAVICIWCIIQTNFMSCFATAQLVYSTLIPLVVATPALGISPVTCALLIGMGSSFGLLLPPASGPPSILLATDWCTPKDSLVISPPLIVVTILTAVFIAYPIAQAMFF